MSASGVPILRYPLGLLTSLRAWNISLRTLHLAAMGVLLGGHAFDVPKDQLVTSLWLCVASGAGLAAVEAGGRLVWFHQVRGLITIAKLAMVCLVPFVWDYRLALLLCVVVLASVGSHMPARFRYYSVVYRRVIRDCAGPGASRLDNETEED